MISALTKEAALRDTMQNSFTRNSFHAAIVEKIKEQRAAAAKPTHSIKKPSRETLRKYERKIVPESVKRAQTQNPRRMEVRQII